MDTSKKQHSNIFWRIVRRAELLLVVLVLPFLFSGEGAVKGSYVVSGVQSHVILAYGQDNYEFDTYKTELLDAITEQGLVTYDQDLFSIPRDTKLYGQTAGAKVTKSLPVVINDEGEHIMGRTVNSNPKTILEQNNIKYWPEDKLEIELIIDPITAGGVGQLVTIDRAPVYTVAVDGKKKEVHTWEKNVKLIVEKSNTKLNPNDVVSPGIKANVTTGAVIRITRINYAKVKESQAIDFSTTYQSDYFVSKGNQKVTQTGLVGKKEATYNITYKNGEEVSKVLLTSVIIKKPTTEIIKKGIMPSSEWDFNRTYWNWMVSASQKYGISPVELYNVASCESHLNPLSTGGGGKYLGLYQYGLNFWKAASSSAGFGGYSWKDARAQIYTTARYASVYGWGKWAACAP